MSVHRYSSLLEIQLEISSNIIFNNDAKYIHRIYQWYYKSKMLKLTILIINFIYQMLLKKMFIIYIFIYIYIFNIQIYSFINLLSPSYSYDNFWSLYFLILILITNYFLKNVRFISFSLFIFNFNNIAYVATDRMKNWIDLNNLYGEIQMNMDEQSACFHLF